MLLGNENLTREQMPSYLPDELYPEKIDEIAQSILNNKLQDTQNPVVQNVDIGNKQSGGTSQWQ